MSITRRSAITTMGLLALTSGLTQPAVAGTPAPQRRTERLAATVMLPFTGAFEGRHVGRTPVAPPVFFDRFEALGEATHLGRFEVVITATVDFGARPVTGVGTYTFTAANGDLLVAHHTGSSALVRPGTVLITEHATVDPARSTGRFAGARGTFTVERLADAATGVGGVTSGTVEGGISLPAPDRGEV
jgi:hypothetical protein